MPTYLGVLARGREVCGCESIFIRRMRELAGPLLLHVFIITDQKAASSLHTFRVKSTIVLATYDCCSYYHGFMQSLDFLIPLHSGRGIFDLVVPRVL